jgi:hypothetical protein
MDSNFSLTASFHPHPDVVWRDVDGEVVLLNVVTGQYFGLDAVGSQVWILLQSAGSRGANLQALCGWVTEAFDVDSATAERDLTDLLGELLTQQLLVVG